MRILLVQSLQLLEEDRRIDLTFISLGNPCEGGKKLISTIFYEAIMLIRWKTSRKKGTRVILGTLFVLLLLLFVASS
jgi:hypothetical protein